MTIGERLKSLRQEKGYTQDQLAQLLLLSRQTIINWEKDRTVPDSDNLARLSAFYGISVDELLGLAKDALPLAQPTRRHLWRYLTLLSILLLGSLVAIKGMPLFSLTLFGLLLFYVWSEIYHTKQKR
ncbi:MULTISPECIES: helix-turn-helix domain-containing protein [unclassified Streptococcus]|uniref:helix-turn-helix domain-containing protein n=1 Tax=unclassified Streptococcus TaxID=2608887 RepID=UPI00359DA193